MKIAVRIDDVTPDMDWQKFEDFKRILDEFEIKPLIGVVPDNQDKMLHCETASEDFWEKIRNLQAAGWSIALHGYQHIYTTSKGGLFPLNGFSEFAGIPFGKQFQMLQSGTEILQKNGIKTDLFMAPAHSYDRNTLKALKQLRYTKLTDGFGSKPYIREGMTFYPISFILSRSLRKKKGITTMVVHTNTVKADGMEQYRRMFEEHKGQFISYSDFLKIEGKKRGIFGNMGEYLMAKLKHLLVKMKSMGSRG